MSIEIGSSSSERIAKVSKATFCLLIGAVFFGALCVVLHSHFHEVACSLQSVAMFLGGLALLKVFTSVSAVFPKGVSGVIHWIHATVFEILALFLIIALRLAGYFVKIGKPTEGNGTPILLVHGFINTSSVWIYMQKALAKEGFGPIYTVSLRRPFHSIERHAERVAEKAEEIRKETGKEELILIGHSMGGLVCAQYATKLAPKGTVKKIITIASPLGGTYMASIPPGANAREMERNSPFVQNLRRSIESREDLSFYTIGTKTDLLVVPSSSSFLSSDEKRRVEYDDVGHASLLFSPRVASQLKVWLSN